MENLCSVPKNESKEENSLQPRGSLTVESALVLPLFFLTITVLAGILDLYRIGVLIQSSLWEVREVKDYLFPFPNAAILDRGSDYNNYL